MRIYPLRLRSRLMLLILAALAPALGLIVYSAYEQQQLREAEVRDSTITLTREIAAKHAQIVERARELLLSLTLLPPVRALDAGKCSDLFVELLPRYPQYLNLVAANAQGDIFCSARPAAQPVSVKTEPSFTRALANRGLSMGEFSVSKITGRPFIAVGYPVLGARGEVLGAVGAILSVDWLNREAAKTRLPAGGALAVVDGAGTLVVRAPDAEKWVGKNVADTPVFRARLRGDPYLEATAIDGVTRVFGIARVDNVPPPSAYYVSVGIPKEQAFGPINAILWRNVLLLAAVAALALATAWYGAEISVVRPVNQLVAASELVKAGDRNTRAAVPHGAPELQHLAQSINAMLDALNAVERRFRETLQNVNLIAVALDAQGNVTFCNDYLLTLTDWRREELLGRNWFDAMVPDAAPVRAMFEQAIRRGNVPPHHENEILTRRSERRLIHWSNTILHDPDGRIIGSVSLGEDITEHKHAEKTIRAQLDELLSWQELMVGREERMLQLKAEVNALLTRQGQPERYPGEAHS